MGIIALVLIAFAVALVFGMMFRVVVPTNDVHIVQKSKKSIPYGKDKPAGNVYYNFPRWIPIIGLTRIILPVSNFTIDLNDYQAYDIGKVPFGVDVKAFFRVEDVVTAAQRVESFAELLNQLEDILKGAIRKILASADIEDIMVGRGKFGEEFTNEVSEQLKEWGAQSVKSIELMDIRDGNGSSVISDIMEKKKSAIERESRVEVATNNKQAHVAEIDARRDVELQQEIAAQAVGERSAMKDQKVGVASEQAQQKIKEQAKITTEKEMLVQQVQQVKTASIMKEVNVVKANEAKEVDIVRSQGEKAQTITIAEGVLKEKENQAKGIQAIGLAEAEAEKAMKLAPVMAEIKLFTEIAKTPEYMEFLLGKEGIQASEVVGVAKAKALESGDLKVIANTGGEDGTGSGINSIMDIFSGKGGLEIGSMLESFGNTESGRAILDKVMGKKKVVKPDLTFQEAIIDNRKSATTSKQRKTTKKTK